MSDDVGQPATARGGTVALIRPGSDLLRSLVHEAAVDAGLPAATVEALPGGIRLTQPDAGPAVTVAGGFVQALDDALRAAATGIGQVRVAMHYSDAGGQQDVERVTRLVGEPVLDDVLRATSGARMVVMVSDAFHRVAIRPGHPSIDRSAYAPIGDAWVRVPGAPGPRGLHPRPARPGVPAARGDHARPARPPDGAHHEGGNVGEGDA
ncbi:hypothetical protein AB0K00_55530 [Dactylosporangium sp. NPDC049525]|uniref:hypothetical protein n=1 Tax=Dactylosporangium sp. NPDC049525 TaxID=3154730 RepID=UPI0034182662